MSNKTHAMYLTKDGESPKLFHADDVDAARADGWSEPDFKKSNGADWNAEDEAAARDAASDFAKDAEARKAKSDAKSEAAKGKK